VSLAYALSLALRSLRRDRGHTLIMVLVLGLGVAAWTASRIALELRSKNQLRDDLHLYYVAIQRPVQDPLPADGRDPMEGGAYQDRELLALPGVARATDIFLADGVARAEGGAPIAVDVLFSTRHLAPLFELPLRAGGMWSEAADRGEERALVLGDAAARALFGESDVVGRKVRFLGEEFTVAGVVAPLPLRPQPARRPLVHAPSAFAAALHARPMGFLPHGEPTSSYEAFLASEAAWLDLWVELEGPEQRARCEAALAERVRAARARGRPIEGARLVPHAEWLAARTFDPPTVLFALFGDVMLGSAALHVARLLDAKRRARRAETACHRAFGASLRAVLAQHLLEAELVALSAGLAGLMITRAAFAVLNRVIITRPRDFVIDARSALIALAGAAVAGLVAGAYPAIAAACAAPAAGLRRA
jgi:putative ABC transport system permease protein